MSFRPAWSSEVFWSSDCARVRRRPRAVRRARAAIPVVVHGAGIPAGPVAYFRRVEGTAR